MRITCLGALVGLATLAAQIPAQATCYMVYDRKDNVIYRETQPPVDMSDRGAAEREAMRQRGEYLMFIETDRCPSLSFVTGASPADLISFDESGGIPAGAPTPSPALGRDTVRAVGVSRGGAGLMRTQPAPAGRR
jgi:hypothetical protein